MTTTHTDNPSKAGKAAKANKLEDTVSRVQDLAGKHFKEYANGHDRPLAGYTRTLTVFGAVVSGLAVVGRVRGKKFPEGISLGDFTLFALGTHKLTRILTKDSITSPLRAPFTQYKEPAGAGEVNEEVRASGSSAHAVGELLDCPFCLAVWVATGFMAGSVFAPRATKTVATTFSLVAVSDALQFAYSGLKKIG